jgi:hypothetical protein
MPGEAGLVALAGILVVSPDVAGSAAPVVEAPGPGGLTLDVAGACPAAAEVQRLLSEVVSADEGRGVAVSIQDRGAHYRIALRETATTLDDPGRDCAARARQAAVVVASELRSHPRVLGPPEWTIEKGLVFDVASTRTGAVWAPGAEFRGVYGSRAWSLVGAAGARTPVGLALEHGAQAELLRIPLDVGARYTVYKWKLRPWFVVGPSFTLTGILGVDVVDADRAWRLDVGGLAMAGATLPVFGRLGGAAAIAIRWQPRPYQLQVAPFGTVGETPVWWFGLSLNYTVDGRASSP